MAESIQKFIKYKIVYQCQSFHLMYVTINCDSWDWWRSPVTQATGGLEFVEYLGTRQADKAGGGSFLTALVWQIG